MEFTIEDKRERLDKFLARQGKKISRTRWQSVIRQGGVKVNDHLALKPSFTVKPKDHLVILEEKLLSKDGDFAPEAEPELPLEIIYEDKNLLVVNKPAGLLTHPTLKQKRHTLANALLARYPELREVGENPLRPGIVHRLDQDTSGLLVIAKNQKAFFSLKEQFLKKTVRKKYLALTYGIPKPREGTIEYAIRPSTQNRLKKVAIKNPTSVLHEKKSTRNATTNYKVIETIRDEFALLEVTPLTGRTHQIRVHLAAIGHPVVGDRLYGRKSSLLKRQFLHAYALTLTGLNKKKISVTIPLPDDLKQFLEKEKAR